MKAYFDSYYRAFIIGLDISYAIMSSEIQIDGYTMMSTANWNIHFEDLQPATILGNAEKVVAPVVQNNTTVLSPF